MKKGIQSKQTRKKTAELPSARAMVEKPVCQIIEEAAKVTDLSQRRPRFLMIYEDYALLFKCEDIYEDLPFYEHMFHYFLIKFSQYPDYEPKENEAFQSRKARITFLESKIKTYLFLIEQIVPYHPDRLDFRAMTLPTLFVDIHELLNLLSNIFEEDQIPQGEYKHYFTLYRQYLEIVEYYGALCDQLLREISTQTPKKGFSKLHTGIVKCAKENLVDTYDIMISCFAHAACFYKSMGCKAKSNAVQRITSNLFDWVDSQFEDLVKISGATQSREQHQQIKIKIALYNDNIDPSEDILFPLIHFVESEFPTILNGLVVKPYTSDTASDAIIKDLRSEFLNKELTLGSTVAALKKLVNVTSRLEAIEALKLAGSLCKVLGPKLEKKQTIYLNKKIIKEYIQDLSELITLGMQSLTLLNEQSLLAPKSLDIDRFNILLNEAAVLDPLSGDTKYEELIRKYPELLSPEVMLGIVNQFTQSHPLLPTKALDSDTINARIESVKSAHFLSWCAVKKHPKLALLDQVISHYFFCILSQTLNDIFAYCFDSVGLRDLQKFCNTFLQFKKWYDTSQAKQCKMLTHAIEARQFVIFPELLATIKRNLFDHFWYFASVEHDYAHLLYLLGERNLHLKQIDIGRTVLRESRERLPAIQHCAAVSFSDPEEMLNTYTRFYMQLMGVVSKPKEPLVEEYEAILSLLRKHEKEDFKTPAKSLTAQVCLEFNRKILKTKLANKQTSILWRLPLLKETLAFLHLPLNAGEEDNVRGIIEAQRQICNTWDLLFKRDTPELVVKLIREVFSSFNQQFEELLLGLPPAKKSAQVEVYIDPELFEETLPLEGADAKPVVTLSRFVRHISNIPATANHLKYQVIFDRYQSLYETKVKLEEVIAHFAYTETRGELEYHHKRINALFFIVIMVLPKFKKVPQLKKQVKELLCDDLYHSLKLLHENLTADTLAEFDEDTLKRFMDYYDLLTSHSLKENMDRASWTEVEEFYFHIIAAQEKAAEDRAQEKAHDERARKQQVQHLIVKKKKKPSQKIDRRIVVTTRVQSYDEEMQALRALEQAVQDLKIAVDITHVVATAPSLEDLTPVEPAVVSLSSHMESLTIGRTSFKIPVPDYAYAVMRQIEERGYWVRIVGGYPRDMLLGLPPNDIDMITNCPREMVLSLLRFCRANDYFDHLCTITDKRGINLTIDIYSITESSPLEYAKSRDISLNAIQCNKEEEVFDYINALSDLRDPLLKMLRGPELNAKYLAEDPSRILRIVRNAVWTRKLIPTEYVHNLQQVAPRLLTIPMGVYLKSLETLFCRGQGAANMQMLFTLGLLEYLFPDNFLCKGKTISFLPYWLQKMKEIDYQYQRHARNSSCILAILLFPFVYAKRSHDTNFRIDIDEILNGFFDQYPGPKSVDEILRKKEFLSRFLSSLYTEYLEYLLMQKFDSYPMRYRLADFVEIAFAPVFTPQFKVGTEAKAQHQQTSVVPSLNPFPQLRQTFIV